MIRTKRLVMIFEEGAMSKEQLKGWRQAEKNVKKFFPDLELGLWVTP